MEWKVEKCSVCGREALLLGGAKPKCYVCSMCEKLRKKGDKEEMSKLDDIGIPRLLDVRQLGEKMFAVMEALGGRMSDEDRDDDWDSCTRIYQWLWAPSKKVMELEVTYQGMDEQDYVWVSVRRNGKLFSTERIHRAGFNQDAVQDVLRRLLTAVQYSCHSYEIEFMEYLLESYRNLQEED